MAEGRASRRADLLRLRAILQLLTAPFSDPEMEHLTVEGKLCLAFRTEEYPIYRRQIRKTMPVTGMWWMDESQWVRYMWQGHRAKIVKTDQDPDRVYTTRSYDKGWAYIREHSDRVDIEAITKTTALKVEAKGWVKGNKKTVYEWITVSITYDEYHKLQPYLGPRNDGCKHDD